MPPVGFEPTISAGERPQAVVCDLETSIIGAPYIYDISSLRIKIYCYTFMDMSGNLIEF